jgi:predicted esterase
MISKTFGLTLLVVLLLSSSASAADKISKETLNANGKKRTYYLFAPSSIKSGSGVPLIILLHGSGRNGQSLVEKWKDLATEKSFVVVGPDAINSQTWSTTEDGPDFLRQLIEAVSSKYPINPRRVYLFGHSGGAVFALNLSMMESEYFAATAVHAGSWRDQKEPTVMDYAKRKIPLAILIGDSDVNFPLSSVKTTETVLKERGFPIEVTVLKGHDHWYYDLAPDINRQAWAFLERYELKEDPRYVAYSDTGSAEAVNTEIKEINALRIKANDAMQAFYLKEQELSKLDQGKDRDAVKTIARSQIELLDQISAALTDAAVRADKLAKMNLKGNYAQYFALVAEVNRKRVEATAATRERAESWLSDAITDSVILKRNEATMKAGRLNKEAQEIEQKAQGFMSGQAQ